MPGEASEEQVPYHHATAASALVPVVFILSSFCRDVLIDEPESTSRMFLELLAIMSLKKIINCTLALFLSLFLSKQLES